MTRLATRPLLPVRILRAALDQAGDAVVVADAAGRIAYANPAVERHVGPGAAELIGRHDIADSLAAGRAWSGSRLIRTPDGLHVRVELVVSPVVDSAGLVTHVLTIGRVPRDAATPSERAAPLEPVRFGPASP